MVTFFGKKLHGSLQNGFLGFDAPLLPGYSDFGLVLSLGHFKWPPL
jgi:hypothetical protein